MKSEPRANMPRRRQPCTPKITGRAPPLVITITQFPQKNKLTAKKTIVAQPADVSNVSVLVSTVVLSSTILNYSIPSSIV